jgi:hypothetical protein
VPQILGRRTLGHRRRSQEHGMWLLRPAALRDTAQVKPCCLPRCLLEVAATVHADGLAGQEVCLYQRHYSLCDFQLSAPPPNWRYS